MCGINGTLRLSADAPPVVREELLATCDAMHQRGPDGSGFWIAEDGGIGLGHRRLAIIDLSEGGAQPKSHADGRFHITFNGEIYNYRELRAELERGGETFTSESDTEVILALYARMGTAMLDKLRGMYGLALWDARRRTLLLARDPYGIKPLYYAVQDGRLHFASQVRALEAGGISADVDPVGLVGFLSWGTVPEPWTIRRHIRAVPAGHYLLIENGEIGEPVAHYRFDGTREDVETDPAVALDDSVRAHLVADVPVAVFLSAGMDSSLIAALAMRHVEEPLTTLTLSFDEYRGTPMDEAPLAAEVARTLGTRHVEHRVRREDFDGLWSDVVAAMDQPSGDGFNTYVVSRVAHEQGFKVVLSGLGGDELFGSYMSFLDVPRWARWAGRLGRVPGLGLAWPRIATRLKPEQPKLAGMLEHGRSLAGAYFLRRGLFLPRELPELIGKAAADEGLAGYDPIQDAAKLVSNGDPWEAVHLMESSQYMRNQLLRDSDWASMAHSLELRVPLVDYRLRESVARQGYEPARSANKAAIVRRAAPELPDAMWNRPKTGFQIPVMEWLGHASGIDAARGPASRRLALDVLAEFGVDLDRKRATDAAQLSATDPARP